MLMWLPLKKSTLIDFILFSCCSRVIKIRLMIQIDFPPTNQIILIFVLFSFYFLIKEESLVIFLQISKIKEKSRELSELKDAEFNSDCVQYNCTYFVPKHTETANTDNMQNNNLGTTLNHPNSSTTTTNATADEPPTPPPTTSTKPQSVAEASEQGSITRNESFFSEHLRNPAKNPLMLNSLNRLNKLEEQLDLLTSEEAAKITVSDASLFKANFKSKSPVKESMRARSVLVEWEQKLTRLFKNSWNAISILKSILNRQRSHDIGL